MISKEELSKQIAKEMKEFEKLGGLIDHKPARKVRVKNTVWIGTNRKHRVQETRGWDAVVPRSNSGYGFSGYYAEWKGEE